MDTYKRGIICQKVVFCTLLANISLIIIKGLAGWQAGSNALLAEAFHSGGDVLASFAIIICLRFASRPPDRCHHYGHGKIEHLVTAVVSILLAYIAYELVMTAIEKIGGGFTDMVPGRLALLVSFFCLLMKEIMYRFTIYFGKRLNSPALIADAWHHRSDVLILAGVFSGVAAARAGFPFVDPLLGLIIALLIGVMAVRFARYALSGLLDSAPEEKKVNAIASVIAKINGVREVYGMRGRYSGPSIFLEAKVGVSAELTLLEGYEIAREIKDSVQKNFPEVEDLIIHIDPVAGGKHLR